MAKKALIAMSGGVDSSVAAYIMQTRGYDCMGGTMGLCNEALVGQPVNDDIADARAVAQRLHIPFHVFAAHDLFCEKVVEQFVNAYESGLTPNPCVQCNRNLKFGYLLQQALALGCDYVVTGHYAQVRQDPDTGRYLLYKALDPAKDQSYFLACLQQEQLAHILFPLGEMTKEQVRVIAQQQAFINARKRDSQDICFIPNGDYSEFLRRYRQKDYPSGDFIDLQGNVVGQHKGNPFYTLGQRKGLGLAMGAPVYVCGKDTANNTVTVGPDEALYATSLLANGWTWFPFARLTEPVTVTAKARSRHIPQAATVYPMENGFAKVVFDTPQRALTPGQAIVLYQGDLVVGGGTIAEIL